MKVICAWCGKTVEEGDEGIVSHGMCADCAGQVSSTVSHSFARAMRRVQEHDVAPRGRTEGAPAARVPKRGPHQA